MAKAIIINEKTRCINSDFVIKYILENKKYYIINKDLDKFK